MSNARRPNRFVQTGARLTIAAAIAAVTGGVNSLGGFVASIAANIGSDALTKTDDPRSSVERAIDTAAEISRHPAITKRALNAWVSSPGWHEVNARLKRDPLAYRDAQLHQRFEQAHDFANPLTERHATIAQTFLEALSANWDCENGISAVRRDHMEARGEQQREYAQLTQLIKTILPITTESISPPYSNQRLEGIRVRLLSVRDLLRDGQLVTAARNLGTLEPELKTDDPSELRQDALRLRGNIALRSNNLSEASAAWCEAYALDRSSAPATLNRAYAAILDREWNAALDFLAQAKSGVLNLEQRDSEAALRVQALLALGRTAEVEVLANESPDKLEVALVRAQHAMINDQPEVVRALLATQLEAAPEQVDARAVALDAHAATMILELRSHSARLSERGRIATLARNDPANKRLEQAVIALEQRQEHALLAQIHNLRCYLLGRAGHTEESLTAARRAQQLLPTEPAFSQNIVLTLARLGRLDEAIAEANSGASATRNALVGLSLGEALYFDGRFEEARQWLECVTVEHAPDDYLAQRTALQADIDCRSARHTDLRALLARLASERPEVERSVAEGVLAEALGDHEAAEAHWRSALEHGGSLIADLARERLINALAKRDQYAEASVLGEPFVGDATPPVLLHSLLGFAVYAYRYAEAKRILEVIERAGVANERSRQLNAWLLEFQGRTEHARLTYAALTADYPLRAPYWLALARLEGRAGRIGEAIRAAAQVNQLPGAKRSELLESAQFLGALGAHEGAVAAAHRAHREHRADADASLALITATIHDPREQPTVVAAECAVLLEALAGGSGEWIVVTRDANPDPASGELALDAPRAQMLIGCTVGNLIEDRDANSLGRVTKRVTQILSKYAYRTRGLLEQYRRFHPDDERLQAVPIAFDQPSGLDPLKATLLERRNYVNAMLERVRTDPLPLEAIGEQIGASRFETWAVLARSSNLGALMFTADAEVVAGNGRALQAPRLLVDLSTLVTLDDWGVLESALEGFELLTVDGLREELTGESRRDHGRAKMAIGADGGIQYFAESLDTGAYLRQRLKRVTRFVYDRTQPVTPESIVEFQPEIIQCLAQGQLWNVFALIAATSDAEAALATENGVVGALATSVRALDSTCAIFLVERAAERGALSLEQRTDCWEALIGSAPRYVLPPWPVIARLVERDSFGFGQRVRSICTLLAEPTLNAAHRAMTFTLIARLILTENPLEQLRWDALRGMLEIVWTNGHPSGFEQLVERAVTRLFKLIPFQEIEFQTILENWLEDHDAETRLVSAGPRSLLILP